MNYEISLGCELEPWSVYDWYQSPDYWLMDLFTWDHYIGDDGTIWERN